MIGIGVIGYGYWGPNLVRNFAETPGSRVVAVSDLSRERLALAQLRHPSIKVTTDYHDLLLDPEIDAIVISTPVSTHFDLATEAMRAGKHVLVEKPLTASVEQGQRLVDEAAALRRILMVEHTFVYTGAVRKIKEIIDSGQLGPIYYYDSVRVNLGLFQHDVNVLWDLAVHDLAIMDYLLDARPLSVAATGSVHLGEKEDIAYLTCYFDNNLIAHFHVNWLAPVKVRHTLIGAARQMVVYDELEATEKVKVYDKGITVNAGPLGITRSSMEYRNGDTWSPQLSTAEALQTEARHFIDCIERDQVPMTSGEVGLRVVQILEAATQSMSRHGQPVELRWNSLAAAARD